MSLFLRLLLPLVIGLASVSPAMALEVLGTVVRVSDGDTLAVQVPNQPRLEKVRLLGVDTPEVAHGPRDPGQEPWGSRARDFTAKLVLNKQVRIETDVQARDRYGRLLGYVYVGRTFVNLELLRHGHAMLLTYAPNVKYVELFTQAQREARTAGRGFWNPKDQLTESPHTYRHNGHQKGNGNIVDDAVKEENKRPSAAGRSRRQTPRPETPAPMPAHAPVAPADTPTNDPAALDLTIPGYGPTAPVNAPPIPNSAGSAPSDHVLLNVRSHKYHEPDCRHATGPNIRTVTRAEAEAVARPCKACHPD
jgi:endonuclease YncB( thermonuclease family)